MAVVAVNASHPLSGLRWDSVNGLAGLMAVCAQRTDKGKLVYSGDTKGYSRSPTFAIIEYREMLAERVPGRIRVVRLFLPGTVMIHCRLKERQERRD